MKLSWLRPQKMLEQLSKCKLSVRTDLMHISYVEENYARQSLARSLIFETAKNKKGKA